MEPRDKDLTNKGNYDNISTISNNGLSVIQLKSQKNSKFSIHENKHKSEFKDEHTFGSTQHFTNLTDARNKYYKDTSEISNSVNHFGGKQDASSVKNGSCVDDIKNRSYINVLKNNVRSVISNIINRKSILGRKNNNEMNNHGVEKISAEKGKVQNGDLEKGRTQSRDAKLFSAHNEFTELKPVNVRSENAKLHSVNGNNMENISPMKKTLINLKGDDNQRVYRCIMKGVTKKDVTTKDVTTKDAASAAKRSEPLNENAVLTLHKNRVKNKYDHDSDDKRSKTCSEHVHMSSTNKDYNRTPSESTPMERKKYISRIPLIKHNKINEGYNVVRRERENINMLNGKMNTNLSSTYDNAKKKDFNEKVKEINRSSISAINRNEKITNKESTYTSPYISNKNKSSNIMYNDTFHKDLKKTLINTIMNPQKEERVIDKMQMKRSSLIYGKRQNSPLNKNILNTEKGKNVTQNSSPTNTINSKDNDALIKNRINFETKQQFIRRYSNAVRNRNSIFKKGNTMEKSNGPINGKKLQENNKNKLHIEKKTLLIPDKTKGCNNREMKSPHEKSKSPKQLDKGRSNIVLSNSSSYKRKNSQEMSYERNHNTEERKNAFLRRRTSVKTSSPISLEKNRSSGRTGSGENGNSSPSKIFFPSNRGFNQEGGNMNKGSTIRKSVFSTKEADALKTNVAKRENTLNFSVNKINTLNLSKESTPINRTVKNTIEGSKSYLRMDINIKTNGTLGGKLKKMYAPNKYIVSKNFYPALKREKDVQDITAEAIPDKAIPDEAIPDKAMSDEAMSNVSIPDVAIPSSESVLKKRDEEKRREDNPTDSPKSDDRNLQICERNSQQVDVGKKDEEASDTLSPSEKFNETCLYDNFEDTNEELLGSKLGEERGDTIGTTNWTNETDDPSPLNIQLFNSNYEKVKKEESSPYAETKYAPYMENNESHNDQIKKIRRNKHGSSGNRNNSKNDATDDHNVLINEKNTLSLKHRNDNFNKKVYDRGRNYIESFKKIDVNENISTDEERKSRQRDSILRGWQTYGEKNNEINKNENNFMLGVRNDMYPAGKLKEKMNNGYTEFAETTTVEDAWTCNPIEEIKNSYILQHKVKKEITENEPIYDHSVHSPKCRSIDKNKIKMDEEKVTEENPQDSVCVKEEPVDIDHVVGPSIVLNTDLEKYVDVDDKVTISGRANKEKEVVLNSIYEKEEIAEGETQPSSYVQASAYFPVSDCERENFIPLIIPNEKCTKSVSPQKMYTNRKSDIQILNFNQDKLEEEEKRETTPIYKKGKNLKKKKKKLEKLKYTKVSKQRNNQKNTIKNDKLEKKKKKKKKLMKYYTCKKNKKYIKTFAKKCLMGEMKKDSKTLEASKHYECGYSEEKGTTFLDDNKLLGKRQTNTSSQVGKKILAISKKSYYAKGKSAMCNFYFNFKKNYNLSLNFKHIKNGKKKKKKFKKYEECNIRGEKKNIKVKTPIEGSRSELLTIECSPKEKQENDIKRKGDDLIPHLNTLEGLSKKKKRKLICSSEKCNFLGIGDKMESSQRDEMEEEEGGGGKGKLHTWESKVCEGTPLASSDEAIHEVKAANEEEVANEVDVENKAELTNEEEAAHLSALGEVRNYMWNHGDIFFYEHEWICIILKLIDNDNFPLAEKMMLLIFQKEEQMYKLFIEEKEIVHGERRYVKGHTQTNELQNVESKGIQSTDEHKRENGNDKYHKKGNTIRLSQFMQQIVDSCPAEWPLLDIGILIIASQIVCYIFNYNKWKLFCDGCRIFEKYCIGILLNSSLISSQKNENMILMFEHNFFHKIITPCNYDLCRNIIKYFSNYLKNDYLIKEKTILDVIFLSLAYYITISQNLGKYIEENNIIYYLNLFHKSGKREKKGITNEARGKKIKRIKRNKSSFVKPWNIFMRSSTGRCNRSDRGKHRFSEGLNRNKLKEDDAYEKCKRRRKTYEKSMEKRMSVLRTIKCVNKVGKMKKAQRDSHFGKMYQGENVNGVCPSLCPATNFIKRERVEREVGCSREGEVGCSREGEVGCSREGEVGCSREGEVGCSRKGEVGCSREGEVGCSREGELGCREKGYFTSLFLFKNNKIDTIVKYQTKTNFEKLLCLIIIEIFNLIYDNREYSVENILIIRKFFRVFLNFAQKKFIALAIRFHTKGIESLKGDMKQKEKENCKKTSGGCGCYRSVHLDPCIHGEGDEQGNSEEADGAFIPVPAQIYDNYHNMWIWIERLFCENFYEISNVHYNVCYSEIHKLKNNEMNINLGKIELISQNIKRFCCLQKVNCSVLKEYWMIFGLQEKPNDNKLASSYLFSCKCLPNGSLRKVHSFKDKIFFKLEKRDFFFDSLTFHFLSSVECICRVYLSMEEIPSFLHLRNGSNIMNFIGGSVEHVSPFVSSSPIGGGGIPSVVRTPVRVASFGGSSFRGSTLRGSAWEDETGSSDPWLKQLKRRLKIYDIQWHEEYEKKYLNLVISMKLLKKKFKENKLFRKIMNHSISSIWLHKSQIYVQYIQITMNCMFFLGYTYNDIYIFIKRNYAFVMNLIEQNIDVNEKLVPLFGDSKKDKEICNESSTRIITSVLREKKDSFIDENFLLMAWEIANFYFCILYYKLELKNILTEILKWIKIFEKIKDKNTYELFKFRCMSYILHILIFTNKYKDAEKMVRHISQHYFRCESCKKEVHNNVQDSPPPFERESLAENADEVVYVTGSGKGARAYEEKNLGVTASPVSGSPIRRYPWEGSNFAHLEKKKILQSHIMNKCYLYDKWINFLLKRYNNLTTYMLKRRNIVKLILFNRTNLCILMKKKKEKEVVSTVSKKMNKLQNVVLALYHICIKLYRSYYYHASILHYNTSQQILAASKYLNIDIKKKQDLMKYITSSFHERKSSNEGNNQVNLTTPTMLSSMIHVDNPFNSDSCANFFKISSQNYAYEITNFVGNESNFVNFHSSSNHNVDYSTEKHGNNDDMFYLHALILSIQIQYTLSICIILCSDLFIFPKKLKRLTKMKKKNINIEKKKKITCIACVWSLFDEKMLRKHFRILNGCNFKKKNARTKAGVKRSKIIDMNSPYGDKHNIEASHIKCSGVDKTDTENCICKDSVIPSERSIQEKTPGHLELFLHTSYNTIWDEKSNRGYDSDRLSTPLCTSEMKEKCYLSDFVSGRYEKYKHPLWKRKKKNMSTKVGNLDITEGDDINAKNNSYRIIVKISTWLSTNAASQLKLFKMCLPELLCVVLALQANMFMSRDIMANIKRIDRILKLCWESPHLVYFATESLRRYKSRKNWETYKNYFNINKTYRDIFLKKKDDITKAETSLRRLCEHFLRS
ncbi:conserved Plasmodium protein, unknown function [Plasmodium ovale]|uniref:Uncharacterized protein n=1 Tax=Plasmodium ovale TaxID=36330 RepID=A0A1D3TJK2_PLAOA|nr:conserved Plasmodium protein, unknown function [Plasmodium ovale]